MHFDNQAKNWDNDPKKIERAQVFAKEISSFIKPNKKLSAFEFGCGTGLLSYHLKDEFKNITLADNSEGMINVLKEKIEKENLDNFNPLLIDLLNDETINEKYNVVYTLMTMHHVDNIDSAIKGFNSILESNGFLCIADLVTEDGSFHSNFPDFNGHKGFDKKELSDILERNGFTVEYYNIAFEIPRNVNGEIKKYPLFLMIGRKTN